MSASTSYYIDHETVMSIRRNITHEFRLPDAHRQILLKGLEQFDDVVAAYFEKPDFVEWLKDRKFRNHHNCGVCHIEFPSRRERDRFQKRLKEAKNSVGKSKKLSGVLIKHVLRTIFRAWLDGVLKVTLN